MAIITLHARRWFQATNGNTFHTVTILVDGIPVAETGIQYGYGDHYIRTAYDWLTNEGYLGAPPMSQSEFSQKHGYGFFVVDVSLKRDL